MNRIGKSEVRKRLSSWLARRSDPAVYALDSVLGILGDSEVRVFLIGGALRELIASDQAQFRDIDLVVDGIKVEELRDRFEAYTVRHTRFGGLKLVFRGVEFDVWPLRETWAFQHFNKFDCSFEDLPRTTFLNIEAIAAELLTPAGRARQVVEDGFFDAIRRRSLNINFEPNPYPALCVVRSIAYAWKLKYQIGERLGCYILECARKYKIGDFIRAQKSHFGYVIFDEAFLVQVFEWLESDLRIRDGRLSPIDLGLLQEEVQLPLWWPVPSFGSVQSLLEGRVTRRRKAAKVKADGQRSLREIWRETALA